MNYYKSRLDYLEGALAVVAVNGAGTAGRSGRHSRARRVRPGGHLVAMLAGAGGVRLVVSPAPAGAVMLVGLVVSPAPAGTVMLVGLVEAVVDGLAICAHGKDQSRFIFPKGRCSPMTSLIALCSVIAKPSLSKAVTCMSSASFLPQEVSQ